MFLQNNNRSKTSLRERGIKNGSTRSISTSQEMLRQNPLLMDTKSLLKDNKINYICQNTDDFLKEEEIDIHGLSTLSEHKIARFKYPKSIFF